MVPASGIGSWPARAARKAALRPALTFQSHVTTYGELADRVSQFAGVMHDCGTERGSRVAYLGTNHPAFLETLFATAMLGAIFVPLNARLSPEEIEYILSIRAARCWSSVAAAQRFWTGSSRQQGRG